MPNEIIQVSREASGLTSSEVHRFSAVEIRERVNLVQEVMQSIMKRDTHYGTIPGTPKPTLYKPGAEVLCVTFRVAPRYKIEDLSTSAVARYRVTCVGTHQTTGIELGEGVGECSSGEEKYKWRSATCQAEIEATPTTMRRKKYYRNGGAADQVRTEPADLANTILKMACKRAMIAMTLNVTAASDIFTQDIEDLPEELRPQEAVQTSNQKTSPPFHDPKLAAHWIAQADAASTPEELTEVWKKGVAAINEARDTQSYDAFKSSVVDRHEALKPSSATESTRGEPANETDSADQTTADTTIYEDVEFEDTEE